MAFDGSVIAALVSEFNIKLLGGRISKIVQFEKEELLLTVNSETAGKQRLLISVNPSLPICYLAEDNRTAPLNAPAFCMLLRKHLQGGKIIAISQPSMERVIDFEIEHYNEMGDLCRKTLTVELMGKHSNIIFRDGTRILDSIRHVSALVSSVREVLPGREYFIPFEGDKLDPFEAAADESLFSSKIYTGSTDIAKALYGNITGLSPQIAQEIAYTAGLDADRPAQSLENGEKKALYASFGKVIAKISNGDFRPNIAIENGEPIAFCPFEFSIYEKFDKQYFDSMSALLINYYSEKQKSVNIRQKTTDLRQIVQTLLSKDYKKYDLQLKQIADTEKKDKYKVYGEILTAYGYDIEPNSTSYKTVNFYTGEDITIPLDPTLSAIDNGKKYFEKYAKLRRTADALDQIIEETRAEIEHLESIAASLDTVANEADIQDVKKEMVEAGFIKNKNSGKNKPSKAVKSAPLHFISSDGFHMYVGKNNYQNEYITFQLADGGDWWFHAKKIPGSHVIVKTEGRELPDRTFEEAGALAAHFCKAEGAEKVEIDYIQRKFIKKPAGGAPGFVIYHSNYSLNAVNDISGIEEVR